MEAKLEWLGALELRAYGEVITPDEVLAGTPLEFGVQTYPHAAAHRVVLFWSRQEPSEPSSFEMKKVGEGLGPHGNNEAWSVTVPGTQLAPGSGTYWVQAFGADGELLWDGRGSDSRQLVVRNERLLFDGTTLDGWAFTGVGAAHLEDGAVALEGRGGLGLLWHRLPMPPDFELTMEWKLSAPDDNSGVMLRFPDPDSKGYDNPAWVSAHFGIEVQIDELGRPDGAAHKRTGAIYDRRDQELHVQPARPPGEWNAYLIRVRGSVFEVELNGSRVSRWTRPSSGMEGQGEPSQAGAPRFVGLQAHSGTVSFRQVRLRSLVP